VEIFNAIFRYFWFILLGVVLVNVVVMRGRMARLVELGRVTQDEADGFLRGFGLAFGIPCVAMGLIALWAQWPSPMCAGILSFRDAPSAASAIVILGAWALLLRWVWVGSGADLLGRVAPALMNVPNFERTYSPNLVRWAITVLILVAGIMGAVTYRTMPQEMLCVVPGVAA